MSRRRAGGGRRSGHDLPHEIPNASDFSPKKHPEFYDPLWLVRSLRAEPQIFELLLKGTTFYRGGGRPRKAGSWALVYLVFTMSPHGSWEPFHSSLRSRPDVWRACGFINPDNSTWVPSYNTLHLRFRELLSDGSQSAFEATGAALIAVARSHEPRIGRHITVDGTHYESWAVMRHDCGPEDNCPDRKQGRLARIDTARAQEMRQRQCEFDDDEEASAVEVAGLRSEGAATRVPDPRGGVRVFIGGHWWHCLDGEAGQRAYYDSRTGRLRLAWLGGYGIHAFDVTTGGMMAARYQPANENEHLAFADVVDDARRNAAAPVVAVAADRGFYVEECARWSAEQGIALVAPPRRRKGQAPGDPMPPGSRWDEEGDPICSCGGPTRRVGRSTSGGRPRIYFRCLLPQAPSCHKRQAIDCSEDWRRLNLWSRRSPAWRAMARARSMLERGHKLFRGRYLVAANSLQQRPHQHGTAPRRLRAVAAMVIDWMRICHRAGWLGGGPLRDALAVPMPVPPPKELSAEAARAKERREEAARRAQRRAPKPPEPGPLAA